MRFAMKKVLKCVTAGIVCALSFAPAFAADTKHDLLTVEAAENIKFSSQTITKAYFYKQQGIRLERATDDLKKSLELLQKDLVTIQEGIGKDKEEKNIGKFKELLIQMIEESKEFNYFPYCELSKYYEHNLKNPQKALPGLKTASFTPPACAPTGCQEFFLNRVQCSTK